MKNKIIFNILTILICIFIIFIQLFFIKDRELFGIKTNLILITVIVLTSFVGIYKGVVYAFCVGILTDFLYGSNYGIYLISYVIVALVIGIIENNYRMQNRNTLILITLIGTSIFEIVECIAIDFMIGGVINMFYLLKHIILASILNIVIVFLLNGVIQKIAKELEIKSKSNDIL